MKRAELVESVAVATGLMAFGFAVVYVMSYAITYL